MLWINWNQSVRMYCASHHGLWRKAGCVIVCDTRVIEGVHDTCMIVGVWHMLKGVCLCVKSYFAVLEGLLFTIYWWYPILLNCPSSFSCLTYQFIVLWTFPASFIDIRCCYLSCKTDPVFFNIFGQYFYVEVMIVITSGLL